MKQKQNSVLRALELAAQARAEKLMVQHRDIYDPQAHHDFLLRSIVMEDFARVCAEAIEPGKRLTKKPQCSSGVDPRGGHFRRGPRR